MPNSKQIVYLSQAQYAELIANSTITVDGVTVTYDENDIYVTPQAEPVTDVKVNNVSVAANGVANIPIANGDGNDAKLGLVKAQLSYGISINGNGDGGLRLVSASDAEIKNETGLPGVHHAIVPYTQHTSTFYGLARAAGDRTQKASSNEVGSYTPEAKGAIQSMLGVSDLIATAENTLVASKAYAVGDVFTANGKLYKATAAIAADAAIIPEVKGEEVSGANCVETKVGEGFVKFTDYANSQQQKPGIIGVTPLWSGVSILGDGQLHLNMPPDALIKAGTDTSRAILIAKQNQAVFYGLAKAAGADEKDSTLPVGQYTDTAKVAIRSMIGASSTNVVAVQDTQPTDADTKIWLPETAEAPVEVPTVAEMNAALATKMSAVFEGDGLVIISGESVWNGGEY